MNKSGSGHYLITGGAGFIGSTLIPHLLMRGDWVTVIDRLLYGGEGLLAHRDHPRFELVALDLCDPDIPRTIEQRCAATGVPEIRALIHLGAAVGHQVCQALGRDDTFRVNVEGAERMYHLAHEMGAQRFIFASTCSVYGRTDSRVLDEGGDLNPVSLYGQSKVEAEKALRLMAGTGSCELMIFRLASVFGLSPRMRFDVLVNQLVQQAHQQGRVVLFHPDHWRPFVHIQDVVQALLTAMEAPASDQGPLMMNLGSEINCVTKVELAEELSKVIPNLPIETSEESLVPPDQDVRVTFSRLENILGFRPARTLRQGIQEVLSALRQGWFVNQPGRYQNRLLAS
jgi:nucleoside-diphosphate-sugar epimerase